MVYIGTVYHETLAKHKRFLITGTSKETLTLETNKQMNQPTPHCINAQTTTAERTTSLLSVPPLAQWCEGLGWSFVGDWLRAIVVPQVMGMRPGIR